MCEVGERTPKIALNPVIFLLLMKVAISHTENHNDTL
jgi:hypothetical protein